MTLRNLQKLFIRYKQNHHLQLQIARSFTCLQYPFRKNYDPDKHRGPYPNNISIAQRSASLGPIVDVLNVKPRNSMLYNRLTGNVSGLFKNNLLMRPEGFYVFQEQAIIKAEDLIKKGSSPHRNRKMVQVFDDLSNTLCCVADLAEFIRMAHPDYTFSNHAEEACLAIGDLVERLNTDRNLYNMLEKVVSEGDIVPTNAVDEHVAKLFLFDFEQCGIHLDEEKRKEVSNLNSSILSIGQSFHAATSEPRAIPKHKLPGHVLSHFSSEGDNVVISGYYSESYSEVTREAAYKIYLYPEEEQEQRLRALLSQRQKMAQLCGFPSFAHRALRGSLAETPDLVEGFLSKASQEIRTEAEEDIQAMSKMKNEINKFSRQEVAMWDVPFLTSIARKKFIDSEGIGDISDYFSLGVVMEGINKLIFDVFGIYLDVEQVFEGEVWSNDVYKIGVYDFDDSLLGYIYCDFYERQGKAHQDCHFTIQGGKELDNGKYQNPIVALHLNFPSPSSSIPTLLSLSQVENLFHEMGHAIHSMLARTQYQHVTGTRCCTDFAEVPSILMEYFANDPRVLHRIAKNYKTGKPLPLEVLEKSLASRCVFSAAELQLQTFYSKLDQCYHGADICFDKTSTTDVLQEIQSQYYSLPYVPNTAWQLRFGHLVGYGAKYYSYLMSRAVASWIWRDYFEKNPFNRSMGEKLCNEVLIHGGGKPPREMVEQFLGKQITPDNLVSALLNDIEKKKTILSKISL